MEKPSAIRNRFSGLCAFLVLLIGLSLDCDMKLWEKTDRVIEHDAVFYYGYLPAFFVFDDIKVEKSNYEYDNGKFWFWTVPTSKGKSVFKMNCGWAVMNAPFFLIAHQVAQWYDYPATGFSEPYKIFLIIGSLFYLFAGCWVVRAILLRLGFSDLVTGIVILLLGSATNLLFYATSSPAMSHTVSFALVSAFTYLCVRWNEEQRNHQLALIGIFFGLITLVRPSNGIVVLFFLLYAVFGTRSIRDWKTASTVVFFFLAGTALAWSPQIAYWWKVAGEYLVYAYGNEGFYWSDPEIKEVLIGFRKGWWVYTPVMFFVIPGFFLMRQGEVKLRMPLAVVYVINLYLVSVWWCWWYGGCFGHRAFVDTYALWAIPLAATVRGIAGSKMPVRSFGVVIAFLLSWLNIFQIYQYEHGSLHHDAMTRKAYVLQFGKLEPVPGLESKLVYPDYEAAIKGDR